MSLHGGFPRYVLVADSGIEGDEERFTVEAVVFGETWSTGVGRTKQAAEFAAAAKALMRLGADEVERDG